MGRTLKSPTRTISKGRARRGFMGQFPSPKGDIFPLVFDSISALNLLLMLEHRRNLVRIAFEPKVHEFDATKDCPAVKGIPDAEGYLDTGEIEYFEGKSSREELSERESIHLDLMARQFATHGDKYEVVYSEDLTKNGFIDTVLLLRPFGFQRYPAALVSRVLSQLEALGPATLEVWRDRAAERGLSQSVTYHLLYHQRLPLTYETLLPVELLPCLG